MSALQSLNFDMDKKNEILILLSFFFCTVSVYHNAWFVYGIQNHIITQDTATIRSTELLAQLGIEDLDLILKERRLRWYGHVERSNGAVKTAFEIQADGKRGPGRPKMT